MTRSRSSFSVRMRKDNHNRVWPRRMILVHRIVARLLNMDRNNLFGRELPDEFESAVLVRI